MDKLSFQDFKGAPIATGSQHREYMDSLKDSRLKLKREEWVLHPNWPSNTFLFQVHCQFRKLSERLCSEVERLLTTSSSSSSSSDNNATLKSGIHGLKMMFDGWQEAMLAHEQIEEFKLYPHLCARFDINFDYLIGEHRELDAQRDVLSNCINEIIASSSKLESLLNQLFEEFIKYDRLLKNHLLEEEELVYPQLLAMSAEEHEDFLRLTSRESIIKAREARRKELESKE